MHTRHAVAFAALVALAYEPAGAALFSDDFDADHTASWTVNAFPATDVATDFFFDYGTVSIPSAPNSVGGTTRGMKLQANLTSAVFGGLSVSPNGQAFTGDYELTFDMWMNVNGPFPVGGSGSTQAGGAGVRTAGNVPQWAGAAQESIFFAVTGDGNSASDYRAYSSTEPTRYPDTSGVYAAGNVAGSSNGSDPYYAGFGGVSAPAGQTASFPQQTGLTLVGSQGMEWHEMSIKVESGIVEYSIDNLLIATVNLADDTVPLGDNILFNYFDTNATSSTDPNDTALLFGLIDNVVVSAVAVPEASTVVAGVGLVVAAAMIWKRRQERKR